MKRLAFLSTLILVTLGCNDLHRHEDMVPQQPKTQEQVVFKPVLAKSYTADEVYFAGERVPVEDPEVRERLENELIINSYKHSSTLMVIKRAKRWRPMINAVLEEHEVPQDFFYLAVAESDLLNKARSYAGAAGMWQFMRATSKDFDLEINRYFDARRDPKLSTIAACKYLKRAYKKFENWTAVAASYNMGMAGLASRMKQQKQESYYDVYLNSETARYVFRIIAFKLILENPEAYGFGVQELEKYAPWDFEEITIKKTIPDLIEFSLKKGITYKELRYYNPAITGYKNKLYVAKGEKYILRIPKK